MQEKEVKRFYNSTEWKLKRIKILERDHFECQDCIARIKTKKDLHGYEAVIHRATEVHHIVEYKKAPELGLDDNNLISLCPYCHNLRHGRVPREFRKKKKQITKEQW